MSLTTLKAFRAAKPVFEVLSNSTRQKIIVFLFDNGTQTVGQIADSLKLTQSNVSYHLKQLAQANLVTMIKIGRQRYYTVAYHEIITLLQNSIGQIRTDLAQVHKKS